jgi:tRNA pseudouridine(38-40) synthase
VSPEAIVAALNAAAPGVLRAWHVAERPRAFHATFSAQWRRYVYLFPLRSANGGAPAPGGGGAEAAAAAVFGDVDATEADPAAVAALLGRLAGRSTDFSSFARDTVPGKGAVCALHAARAAVVVLPCGGRALRVELVADRFLRRMVRVLVATALRESIPAAAVHPRDADALLRLAAAGERRATGTAAPALGLCLAGAGYDDAPWPGPV